MHLGFSAKRLHGTKWEENATRWEWWCSVLVLPLTWTGVKDADAKQWQIRTQCCNCSPSCKSWAVLLTAQSWGTILFAEPSVCCYPLKAVTGPAEVHINNLGKDQAVRHLGVTCGSLGLRDSTQHWTLALSCCLHPRSVSICLRFLAFHVLYTQQQSFCLSKSTLRSVECFSAFSFLWSHLKLHAEGNAISVTIFFHAR